MLIQKPWFYYSTVDVEWVVLYVCSSMYWPCTFSNSHIYNEAELAQKARKEIADYLSSGKDERARIRVEHIIREDYLVEAMEILELYCDLLLTRFGLIQSMKWVSNQRSALYYFYLTYWRTLSRKWPRYDKDKQWIYRKIVANYFDNRSNYFNAI